MKKDPLIFIGHIIECITDIENFSKNASKEKFKNDKLIQNAILRSLEIMGEAVKNIPEDFRRKHPEIEWKKITGTRDILIHQYFGVDLDLIWQIVETEIPKLKRQIKAIK